MCPDLEAFQFPDSAPIFAITPFFYEQQIKLIYLRFSEFVEKIINFYGFHIYFFVQEKEIFSVDFKQIKEWYFEWMG